MDHSPRRSRHRAIVAGGVPRGRLPLDGEDDIAGIQGIVSTARKSQARKPRARALQDSAHDGPLRRGAGAGPECPRMRATVVADTRYAEFQTLATEAQAAPARILLDQPAGGTTCGGPTPGVS